MGRTLGETLLLRLLFGRRSSSALRLRRGQIAAALALCACSAVAGDDGSGGPPVATSADANACAALAADAGRLASKYTLGQRACAASPASVAPGTASVTPSLPRARQAQQLYLYETPGDLPPVPRERAAVTPTATPPTLAPVRRQQVTTPSRTISKAPTVERALRLAPAVDATARAHDIDPLLLHAIARVESRHDPQAVSPAGARGVMQVMPTTARRFGVGDARSLHHAPTNLEVSAAYLKTLQGRFGNNLPLVLAAYNAGEGAVERHGLRIPPYAETQRYVHDVLGEYQRLRAALGAKGLM